MDETARNESDYLDLSPSKRHAADVLSFRKYQDDHLASVRGERDDWKRRYDELEPRARGFDQLDDRRQSVWINGVLAGMAILGGGAVTIWPTIDAVRILGGSVVITAAVIMIFLVLAQGRKASASR